MTFRGSSEGRFDSTAFLGFGGAAVVGKKRTGGMSPGLRRAVLGLFGASLLVASVALSWRFTVQAPRLRATTETAVIICGLASIVFVWSPWSRSRHAADLLALAALLTLVLENLEFFTAPAIVGAQTSMVAAATSSASRLLVAAVFAAAALAPRNVPPPPRPRSMMLLVLVALCPIALGIAPFFVAAASSDSAREINQAIFTAPAICLLFVAAGAFMRTSVREPTGMIEALLGAAAILLGAAWVYNLLVPGVTARSVAGSVLLRVGAFGLIFIAALNVRARHQRAEIEERLFGERRKLAGDIHDGIAQDLAVIAAYEPRLTQDFGAEHPVTVAARRALSAARGSIIDLSASREPTAADALRAVAAELARRHGVRIEADAGDESLAGDEREAVVRIAREAIVNAVRHGGAKNITVKLRTDGSQLTMTIDDDGCGLRPTGKAGPQQGYGLREMNEWAQEIGGQLTTQQGAHGGTAVKVLVS